MSQKAGRLELDHHGAFFDLNLVSLDRRGRGRAKRGTGLHIEFPLMKRAFNASVFQKTIAEQRELVRAYVMRCIDFTIHQVQGDLIIPDRRRIRFIGVQIVKVCCEFECHRFVFEIAQYADELIIALICPESILSKLSFTLRGNFYG